MTSYLKLVSILLIVSGQNPFLLLGLQTPRAWFWSQDNKVSITSVTMATDAVAGYQSDNWNLTWLILFRSFPVSWPSSSVTWWRLTSYRLEPSRSLWTVSGIGPKYDKTERWVWKCKMLHSNYFENAQNKYGNFTFSTMRFRYYASGNTERDNSWT